MADVPAAALARRLARVRARFDPNGIDALLVTHLPNVAYLTGLRASAGCLVLTRDAVRLIVDSRYADAARAVVEKLGGVTCAGLAVAGRSLEEATAEQLRSAKPGRLGLEADHLSVARHEWLRTTCGARTDAPALVPTQRLVEQERAVKDSDEVRVLREAGRRLSAVGRDLVRLVRKGRPEREIAADIDWAVRMAGFERPAFETIVASGPRSAEPHARPGPRPLEAGDAVMLDFGGVYDGYCVDLSRTLSVGDPRPELERLHRAVTDACEAALAVVRPGVTAGEIDEAARRSLAGHGLAEAFAHGTGHGLGLEVHEEPRIGRPVAGLPAVTLVPGMVFTVEPGVYVPGVAGVRIEDDVLVTDHGYETLTDVPRSLIVV